MTTTPAIAPSTPPSRFVRRMRVAAQHIVPPVCLHLLMPFAATAIYLALGRDPLPEIT